MAEQIYYSVFTKQGLALLTEAIQNGTKLGITSMAFGDGNGSLPIPNENFTSMVREVHRTQLNSLAPDPNNANWLRADAIIASATGGFNIRELGLYAGNVLVAYSNYPPTYKPNPSDGTARIMSFRMILQIDNTANFDLVIDPDVVLATIQSVNEVKDQISVQIDEQKKIFKNIDVESYELLKLITPDFEGQRAILSSIVSGKNLGGGNFVATKGKFIDDGGYTCVVNEQWAWRRCSTSNIVYATEFGLVDGGQLDIPLDNAIKYALENGIQSVYIPTTGKNPYQFNGGLSYDLRNSPIMISAGSFGGAGQMINHTGANIGLTFRSFADLWSSAVLLNFRVQGTANGVAFARFSDSWQNHFDHSFVWGYTNGSIAEIYNDANWTENFCSIGVTSRECKNGFYFHRNPNENTSSVYPDKHATESFYRTNIKNFNFQHGLDKATSAIVVGNPNDSSNSYSHCNLYSSEIDMGGWFEGGGDSTGLNIVDGSVVHLSSLKFRYDGIFSLGSNNPPFRLIRLSGPSAKILNSEIIRQDMQVGIIDINNILVKNGTTNLFPFRSVCFKTSEFESQNGIDTFDAKISPIKFSFSLKTGEYAIISLQRFFKASEYRIKVTQSDAVSNVYRYHSQGTTNVGYLVCETLHPKVTTTLNTSVTPNLASSEASVPSPDGPIVRLLGNMVQGAYSSDSFLGCEVYVPAVSSDSTFTVMIEKIS
ncbi:phage tail protein [Acinetobacter ursingii]|uniref:phage tail protein n=1 Tax=Acinetobacter ursingii TaxID=108980 RepID=UPI003AF7CE31